MAHAGYPSTLKIGGTPTAMTGEATTANGSHTVYQITDAARRALNPSAAITVKADGVAVTSGYTVDALFGKITFSSARSSGEVITVDAEYIPLLDLVEVNSYDIDEQRKSLDDTIFGDEHESALAGQKTASGTIGQLDAGETDLDAGSGTMKLAAVLTNGAPKLLEINTGGTGHLFRGWVLLTSRKEASTAADLVKTTFSWKLAPSTLTGFGSQVACGWSA